MWVWRLGSFEVIKVIVKICKGYVSTFIVALTFHCLYRRQDAVRQYQIRKNFVFPFAIALTFHYLLIR